jgi:CheY-like chemotaxis protein
MSATWSEKLMTASFPAGLDGPPGRPKHSNPVSGVHRMSYPTNIAVVPSAWTLTRNEQANILIVDNDEDVLIALERTLEDEGYATATAASQEEALQLLSQGRFECLVLDDYLSDKDSISVLTELRRLEMTPPAVVVTYHRCPSKSFQARVRLLGVRALINKRAYSGLAQVIRYLLDREAPERRIAIDSMESFFSDAKDLEGESGMFLPLPRDCPKECCSCRHARYCQACPLH